MNCQISFGQIKRDGYDYAYSKIDNMNGMAPDQKVVSTIQRCCPAGSTVADIGAGDGRNAVPLAVRGYSVDAFELSKMGREQIRVKKRSINLPNLRILSKDIFKSSLPKGKYDGVVMSHVTQHFTPDDMSTAFERLYKGLKQGGVLLFDALEDKVDGLKDADEIDVTNGSFHFRPGFINNLAKRTGFVVDEVTDYAEDMDCRGDYYGFRWGFENPKERTLILGEEIPIPPRPVQLKWFTLKKPVQSAVPESSGFFGFIKRVARAIIK